MSDAPITAIHSRAEENLRVIRGAMEASARFTGVSGWGQIGVGLTALVAAGIASLQASPLSWLAVWVIEAVLAASLSVGATFLKARRASASLLSRPGRRFLLALAPPLAAGAVMTPVLFRAGLVDALPGMWMTMYGAGVVTGGAFSIRVVPLMGLVFMVAGVAAVVSPAAWKDACMALGFGGIHLAFGAVIARRHGG